MKRRSDSARAAITPRPRRMSSSPVRRGAARARAASRRLPAIDLIGASELLISWPSTRTSRCQAWRSSSRSARLRSESTSSWCGRPPWRKRAAPHLPAAGAAREASRRTMRGGSPVESAAEPQLVGARARAAARPGCAQQPLARAVHQPQACASRRTRTPRRRSPPSPRAAARVASSAPSRCSRSVSRERVDLEQRQRRARRRARAPRARIEKSPSRSAAEQVGQRLQRADRRARARRSANAEPRASTTSTRRASTGRLRAASRRVHSSDQREQPAPGSAGQRAPAAGRDASWRSRRVAASASVRPLRARSAGAAGRARCGDRPSASAAWLTLPP